jgi:thiol-disulfide isomerase/thioredoxin
MKRPIIAVLVALTVLAVAVPGRVSAAEEPKKAPKDRVVAMYFHRTQRCPTCQKMGTYTEEAMKTGFAKQLKDRTVEFHYVDFEDKKKAAFAKAYKVTGPALVVARVADGKVAEFKNLKDIWTHVGDKKVFVKYVQGEVASYQGKKK